MRVVLLLLALLFTVFVLPVSAQTSPKAYLVRLSFTDPENAYNANFHDHQLKLAELQGLYALLFIEEENAFLLKTDASVTESVLKEKIGGESVVYTIQAADYQRLWNQQYAYKLAVREGKGAPADVSFPKYQKTSNTMQDRSTYRLKVINWLETNPMEQSTLSLPNNTLELKN